MWAVADDEQRRQLAQTIFEVIYIDRPHEVEINPRTGKPRRRGQTVITKVIVRPEYAPLFARAMLDGEIPLTDQERSVAEEHRSPLASVWHLIDGAESVPDLARGPECRGNDLSLDGAAS